jgi:NAD(P)-dependent dehydrogenase (short-subunit alcohol dehydrogenase family)
VVSLSSNAHKRGKIAFDDLQQERSYSPMGAYSQTKLAMLIYARELQKLSQAHGGKLVSIAAHPGLSATAIGRELKGPMALITGAAFKILGQSDAAGALPQIYAAVAPGATPGGYYGPDGFMEFKGNAAPAAVPPPARTQPLPSGSGRSRKSSPASPTLGPPD